LTSGLSYGVIGAGRQGTGAAWYLATRADPESIAMIDRDARGASRAAARINDLTQSDLAFPHLLDVSDSRSLGDALARLDIAVCALPYSMILPFTRAAIAAGTSMVDLGGHSETVRRQLELDEEAARAGVTVIPDCGMGPGMSNTMGLAALDRLHQEGAPPVELRMWEAGLPQTPQEPWGYVASFNLEGLTNEYDGHALFLRDGRVTKVEALTELEHVIFDGLGELEAFVTSGGTSTLSSSLEGVLETLENKTCRYPGHLERFRAYRDLGLFSTEPIEINGQAVSPRDLYHRLLGPILHSGTVEDVCVIRARAVGHRDGLPIAATLELIDHYQPETGFSAMERITGGHAALMATFIGKGMIGPGVKSQEHTLPAEVVVEAAREWGFPIIERLDEGELANLAESDTVSDRAT
jgi:lysine 6-dehydrogenase